MTTQIYLIEFQSIGGTWETACEADGFTCVYNDRDRADEIAQQLEPQFDQGRLRVTEFHRGQSRDVG